MGSRKFRHRKKRRYIFIAFTVKSVFWRNDRDFHGFKLPLFVFNCFETTRHDKIINNNILVDLLVVVL